MQGSQLLKLPRKNKGGEPTRGMKKATILEEFTSMSETVWRERKSKS